MPSYSEGTNAPIDRDLAAGKTILVFGASGQQGGAVAAALRSDGWAVRALLRNLDSDKARSLSSNGVELVSGDLSDSASIRTAMAGAYGVFSVQPSSGQGAAYGVSDEDEIRYGTTIAELAAQAGIQHLVYTSVNAAGPQKTGMGHFDSKSAIESRLRDLDLKSTIIRPAGFMELLMLPGMGLDKGFFMSFVRAEQKAQVIAVQDIGKIVAAIFAAPSRFVGQTIEIAGDEITGTSLQDSLSRAAGRPIAYGRFPDSLLQENGFLRHLVELIDDGCLAGHADIGSLRTDFGPLMTFDDWLVGPGKVLLEAALHAGEATIALR